jgi:hypothetical protein
VQIQQYTQSLLIVILEHLLDQLIYGLVVLFKLSEQLLDQLVLYRRFPRAQCLEHVVQDSQRILDGFKFGTIVVQGKSNTLNSLQSLLSLVANGGPWCGGWNKLRSRRELDTSAE